MQVGIVGLPRSGKSTLFRALSSGTDGGIATVKVPDGRIAALSDMFRPKKTTYPSILFRDIDIALEDDGSFSTNTVQAMREADAVAVVVRNFKNDAVAHPKVTVDPLRDLKEIEDMLFLTDLLQIERRLDRLEREHKKDAEYKVLSRIGAGLEEGRAIYRQKMAENEKKSVSGFRFLSAKPLLVVLNKDENDGIPDDAVTAYCIECGYETITFFGRIEEEIGMLPPEEQKDFLDDIGLAGSATSRFVRSCYSMLDLISFFTVGEDEVRAWNIRRGSSAAEAAARIHTDIAKGFIRAETVLFEQFVEAGSFKVLKERGLLRLESKEYTVQDGEIMHFRFNL
ncbi:MAG: redox-regulated ATPase YchF [Spirochaetes bacterium]|nr:redox-regulated ATPase YchF [Spirochaetota bacterium]